MPLRILLVWVVVISIAVVVHANNNPAERFDNCIMDVPRMTKFMNGIKNSELGYVFNITAIKTNQYLVGMWGTNGPNNTGNDPFVGLLLWAKDGRGQPVGTWQLPSSSLGYAVVCGGKSITHDKIGARTMLSIDSARPSGFTLTVPTGITLPIQVCGTVIKSLDKWQMIPPTPVPAFDPTVAKTALASMNNKGSSNKVDVIHPLLLSFLLMSVFIM